MKDYRATVKSNTVIAENVYMITLTLPEAAQIRGGQFADISVGGEYLLRRPLGICIAEGRDISLCYQVKGGGTKKLTEVKPGDKLDVLLPLGNGFDVSAYKSVAVIGGGVGIFPLLSVIRENYKQKDFYSYIGFRSKSCACLLNEFEKSKTLTVTTDDGSAGVKGNAVEAFLADFGNTKHDAIIACGPPVMLSVLKKKLAENNINIPCYVSLEERMGCGIGACLVCVCKKTDGENARVCKDGPVFNIEEVEL